MEHVSHFNQKMAVHSKDETLMCKIFPSSLGPMAMRWFNGPRANSIDSFKKLNQSFGARFITCRRVPLPLGSLLSMSMREGEILKAYSDRYWEMFNEIDGSYDDVTISTFKAGLRESYSLANLSPVYACWQIGLTSTGGLRRISCKEKGKRRWSLKRGRIPGRIGCRTIDLRETFQGNLHLPTPRRSTLCFENQCRKS